MEQVFTVFDRNPVLEGNTILLRKMSKPDAQDMYDYASDPEVTRYLLWDPHPSLSYTKRYLEEVMRQYRCHNFFDFAVICKEDGRMIGTCGFSRIDTVNQSCEIGYVLSPRYWHRHIATEAVDMILRFAFCNLGFNRVEARYMTENVHSRAVMEKNGMVFEGIEREGVFAKGAFHDVGKCALLRKDYFQTHTDVPFPLELTQTRRPFSFFS